MPLKRSPDWMRTLPVEPEKLTFQQLASFKRAHELFIGDDLKGAPAAVRFVFSHFRRLHLFAMILLQEQRFPVLNRCWSDIWEKYAKHPLFDDGVFIESWIFFDLPVTASGQTIIDEYESFSAKNDLLDAETQNFIQISRQSRLGLYQEVMSTSRTTKFRELFTGDVISTLRSVPEYESGEIFISRILQVNGDRFLFGDPKNWPKEFRETLELSTANRIENMLGDATGESYSRFMKLSGPYWISMLGSPANEDPLSPEHWKSYRESLSQKNEISDILSI